MAFARSCLINIFKRYLTRTSFCKREIDVTEDIEQPLHVFFLMFLLSIHTIQK